MINKVKGSRSWSRVLATQALYQLSLNKSIDLNTVKKNLLNDKETKNVPDRKFFFKRKKYKCSTIFDRGA